MSICRMCGNIINIEDIIYTLPGTDIKVHEPCYNELEIVKEKLILASKLEPTNLIKDPSLPSLIVD